MGKKAFFLFLVAGLCALLLAVPACKSKPVGRPAPPAGEPKGDLHITHATPQDALVGGGEAGQIVVIFDRTMAPLEPLPIEDSEPLLKIEPSFPGTYRWMGTKALTFTPKERFPFGTTVKVTIPAGLRSLDGYALREDYAWSFETPRPFLVRSLPLHEATQIKLETPVILVFSQPVDPDKVKGFIAFAGTSADGQTHAPAFALSRPSAKLLGEAVLEAKPETAVLLEPGEKLRLDYTYGVELKSGLPGTEGPLGMEQNAILSFETYKTLKFTGLEAQDPLPPGDSFSFNFTNRIIIKDFISKVTFQPNVEIPDYYKESDYGDQTIYMNLALAPETTYTARIAADLKDEFGNVLGQEAVVKFTTGPYPSSVRMTTGQGVIEAYADPVYPIYARNAEKVRVMAAALSPDEILTILKSERALWENTFFQPRPSFYAVDRVMPLKLERNKGQYLPISLKELLRDGRGLVFLQLDTYSSEEYERYPKAMLQVTDLAVTGKFSADADLIWVTDLKGGQPVADAEVEIRDGSNQIRWRGRTGPDGKTEAPGWRALGIKPQSDWMKPEQWVFVRRGADVAFTSSQWGTGVEPYRFDLNYDWSPEPEHVRGYIFTERGIYRAGETVHIKGILRKPEKGRWTLLPIKDVECEITDPFQKSVHKAKAVLDDFGSFALDLETRENAALGFYNISVKVPPERAGAKPTTIDGSFRVEAFRPAEFEVHLRSQKDAYVFGEPYQAEIRANFLFGGPMANQKADWTLRLDAASFSPPGFKGYVFGTEIDLGEEIAYEPSRLLASGSANLNLEGKLAVSVPLAAEKETSSVMAALEATVTSSSRKAVSNRIQTIVHRGEFYIGIKPGSSFIKKDEALTAEILTAFPDGALATDRKIAVKLLRREWRSARKAGIGGRYEWVSEKVDTTVAERAVRTGKNPVSVSFQPDKSGLYVLSAEGQDGRKNLITTSTYVYVTGTDYVPWLRADDDALDLVADSETYKPGDKARIVIKSPYEKAKALVTIERESILQSQVLEIKGSVVPIEIPITSDLIPNAYVSVLLVQGRTSGAALSSADDVGKPSFKIGYVKLGIDPAEKRLSLDVTADKLSYKPREKVRVKIKVKDAGNAAAPASLAVAVVDVGVLNLIGYQTPDPFSWFYGEKPLSVQTADSRIHIVGQRQYGEKGENAGGGGGPDEARSTGLSEVELRGDFRTTPYWNPSLLTDAQGEVTFDFVLPDNLTTFRVMAVAQTKDSRFGRRDADLKVSKALLLLPSAPRFARIGDSFEAGVLINNYSGRRGSVVLAVETEGLLLKDKPERSFDLNVNESREVLFAFQAAQAGRARLAIRAKMGADTDGVEFGIPVALPRTTETAATFDETQGMKEEKVNLPETIDLANSKLEVSAAASALTGLRGCLEFLANYPYLCLEQKVSSILPFLVAAKLIEDFQLTPVEPKAVAERIRTTVKDIFACQKESGGFSLWPDTARESPYASVYAVFALIKAKDSGYAVDPYGLGEASTYLHQLLSSQLESSPYPYGKQAWLTTQAFALYDLALLGRFDPAAAELLFQARGQLSVFGRTLLLKALAAGNGSAQARATLLKELLNLVKVEASRAHFEESDDSGLSWIYSSNARTSAVVLQALIETDRRHPLISGIARWLVDQRKAGRWHTTQENFFVFYALNDFYRAYEGVKPAFKAEIVFAGKAILQEAFASVQQTAVRTQSLAEFKSARDLPVKISKTGPGTLYYGLRLTYVPKQALQARDEGMAVYKTLTTLDGKPLAEIKAGQTVLVTLQVLVPKESLFVVVDDPLPAGFEAINPAFATESEEAQRKLNAVIAEAEGGWWWWRGFNHIEMRDDRVLLFADSLDTGVHTHRYLARALTPGLFLLPGSKAEMMYAPETFGRSAERSVRIVK